MDSTGLDITSKLARLDLPEPSSSVLSLSEIYSLHRVKLNLTWRNPPAHRCGTQLRVLTCLYSAGDLGHFRRPWCALETVTYGV
ncbi:hypothetical protein TNCV_3086721 [Trichonephila clavipes]|nr:hypothetical protein TNCV_3086721 [Trichonephila clavipes]